MTLYSQIASAARQADIRGTPLTAIALTLDDQLRLSEDAGMRPARLQSVMGIPVVELQLIHPTSDVPSNLKEVN